jgi:hypothetical protein
MYVPGCLYNILLLDGLKRYKRVTTCCVILAEVLAMHKIVFSMFNVDDDYSGT